MSLLKYFKKDDGVSLPSSKSCPSLTKLQLKGANESVKEVLTKDTNGQAESQIRRSDEYDNYTADDRTKIGKYAAENGPTRAARHFSAILNMKVMIIS